MPWPQRRGLQWAGSWAGRGHAPYFVGNTSSSVTSFCTELMTKSTYWGAVHFTFLPRSSYQWYCLWGQARGDGAAGRADAPRYVGPPPGLAVTDIFPGLPRGPCLDLSGSGAFLVAQMVKNLPAVREIWVRPQGWEGPLEKRLAPHSCILTWTISWTAGPGRLQSMGHKGAKRAPWARWGEGASAHPLALWVPQKLPRQVGVGWAVLRWEWVRALGDVDPPAQP